MAERRDVDFRTMRSRPSIWVVVMASPSAGARHLSRTRAALVSAGTRVRLLSGICSTTLSACTSGASAARAAKRAGWPGCGSSRRSSGRSSGDAAARRAQRRGARRPPPRTSDEDGRGAPGVLSRAVRRPTPAVLATIARRPVRVRWHLVVLVLGAIAPLLALAVVGVRRDLREQRQILERGMQQVARALSVAADREVRTSFAILETLAASPALASGDLRAFHELCVRAIAARKDSWIILFDRSGQQVLNTSRPFGSPLPNPLRQAQPPAADPRYPLLPLGGAAPVAAVLETAQPVTSDLFVALDSRRPTIGIAIPVIRDGAVAYVLEMSVDPDLLLRLLMDQRPPPDPVVTLVDRRDVIIARTLDQPRRVGSPMAPDLAAQITRRSDGLDLGHTAEGLRVYHIFTRSRLTGWAVSVAVSENVIAAPMTRSIVVLSGGVAAALLIGLGAAFLLGKRISGPLSVLAGAADAMARGERIELRRSALREVEDLHGALVAAGAAVRSAASEREQRLVAETKREEAQAANRAKDEFLAMLSHELRTPINAVFGWSRMLQSGQVPEGGRARALDAIVRNANAQVQLIDDLLDVSRVISGKMRLDVRPVDVRVVVEAAVDAVRPAADAKAIR